MALAPALLAALASASVVMAPAAMAEAPVGSVIPRPAAVTPAEGALVLSDATVLITPRGDAEALRAG